MPKTFEQCKSLTKSTQTRCHYKCLPHSDFCGKHQKTHILVNQQQDVNVPEPLKDDTNDTYLKKIVNTMNVTLQEFIQKLNDESQHTLFGLETDWNNIPKIYIYRLDNQWWDIRSLIQVFTGQLNRSDMERAYPIYPENPFTRKRIEPKELIKLRVRVEEINKNTNNSVDVNETLKILCSISLIKLNCIYVQDDYNSVLSIINLFEKQMRYKLIKYINSQGNYCGYWVDKNTELTQFEKCLYKYRQSFVIVEGMLMPIRTRRLLYLQQELDNLPDEEYMY